jgi:hypothetical protein
MRKKRGKYIMNKKFKPMFTLMGLCVVVGCAPSVNSTTTNTTTSTTSAYNTSSVFCSLKDSGTQRLVYDNYNPMTSQNISIDEALNYNYSWTCQDSARKLEGNGVPNHVVTGGSFATKVSAQTVSVSFPSNPALTSQATSVKEPGYAINSVKFDPATAGTCPDTAVDDKACDYGAGSDTWKMVALGGDTSPWKFGFGTDKSNAHVQPNGAYHYHGVPEDLLLKLNASSTTSMTLVGWAVDGFPIYARYGYSSASDSKSALKVLKSSYKTKAQPDAGRPSVSLIPMGHFEQDWEYVKDSGDLDECNGRVGVTPEFPNGIYHYYMTDTYPFIQRCVKGTVSASAVAGPPAGGPPPGGPPPGGAKPKVSSALNL